MRTQLSISTMALALLASVGIAAAQNPPAGGQEQLNLSATQERAVSQGLSHEPSQSAQGYQGQVGSKPPESLKQQPLPNNVTAEIPQTKRMLFIKLPDRILLIDPDRQAVAEIVAVPATTGSGANPISATSPQNPAQENR
jgi:hypothetical protein